MHRFLYLRSIDHWGGRGAKEAKTRQFVDIDLFSKGWFPKELAKIAELEAGKRHNDFSIEEFGMITMTVRRDFRERKAFL